MPAPGSGIPYSYLWQCEATEGRKEAVKDRPCAIVLVVHQNEDIETLVAALPSPTLLHNTMMPSKFQQHSKAISASMPKCLGL